MDPVIAIRGLTKTYGGHRGIEDLDLTVGPAEVVGFLGPNGAGKTTTMRILRRPHPADGGRGPGVRHR